MDRHYRLSPPPEPRRRCVTQKGPFLPPLGEHVDGREPCSPDRPERRILHRPACERYGWLWDEAPPPRPLCPCGTLGCFQFGLGIASGDACGGSPAILARVCKRTA